MPTPLDRILAWGGSALLLLVLGWQAVGAAGEERGPRRVSTFVAEAAPEDAGVTPGSIPVGASIDPETLQLVGVELQPEEGSQVLNWSTLEQYEYREGLEGLPDSLRALEGQRVTMAGFLLPLYEFEDIKDFNLVASHWSCCFGVPPGINGWVHVTLRPGQRGLDNTTEPLKITGTFRIEEQTEAGYVVSIYAIEDAKATVLGW